MAGGFPRAVRLIMADVVIRRAWPDDVPGIARVHWDSHQTTYIDSGRVERELIEAWTFEQRVERWTRAVAIAVRDIEPDEGDVPSDVWVAIDGERIIGWAESGRPRAADAPRDLELHGLYVLDEYHGTGVGQALLDAAIGDRPALVWALGGAPTEPSRSTVATGSSPMARKCPSSTGMCRPSVSCADRCCGRLGAHATTSSGGTPWRPR